MVIKFKLLYNIIECHFRDTICKAFEGSNRGAILTTHYMDEADALCSKVGIMVKGKLKLVSVRFVSLENEFF